MVTHPSINRAAQNQEWNSWPVWHPNHYTTKPPTWKKSSPLCQYCVLTDADDNNDEDESAGESETESKHGKNKNTGSLDPVTACELCVSRCKVLSHCAVI